MTLRWLLRRLGFMVVVIFSAIVINFIVVHAMPGSAADVYTSGFKLPEEAAKEIIRQFGLDKPVMTQFGLYLKNVFTGNLGLSFFYYPKPVSSLIKETLPWSLFLILTSTIIAVPIGYLLGTLSGWRPGSKRDSGIQVVSLALLSTPIFWIGMILLFVFGFTLRWFPLSGAESIAVHYSSWLDHLIDILKHAFLPILTLIFTFGVYELIMRNTMVTTIKEDYVLLAEAKGLNENEVKYKHAARNALLPLVTSVALRFAMAVAGSVFIETVFSYPGIGRLMYNSVLQRDYPVLQGGFLIYSVVTVVVIFILDLIYLRLDPRVRY